MKINLIMLLLGSVIIAGKVLAHGYQTAPYSRTSYVVDTGQKGKIHYNENQISNNLPNSIGTSTLDEIKNYVSKTKGVGPIAFYKDYYPIKDDTLCGYTANNQGYLEVLNEAIPSDHMTKVSSLSPVQFNWKYSAWHNPSNNFVFITEYPSGHYKPNPSLNDLHLVCTVPASKEGNWQCNLPKFNGNSKQVMVTIWQRVDSAGENFISCADVMYEEGKEEPTEKIWSLLGKNESWTSSLKQQPKNGDLVTFNLNVVETYSVSINSSNINQWDNILAAKINNETTKPQLVAIGELNSQSGAILYNEKDKSRNLVYLNNTISDPHVKYSYAITKKKDPNPVVVSFGQIGEALSNWVSPSKIKKGDQLTFALQVDGVEETITPITVGKPENAEKQLVSAINKHTFNNNLKVEAGVMSVNGKLERIQYLAGGDNRVYASRANNDTRMISYVVRNNSEKPKYTIYPSGIGQYKVGDLVEDNQGVVYACLETGWCNQSGHTLTSGTAWKVVHPKPAKDGISVYPEGQPYEIGSVVADVEGNLYKCTVANWCNDKSWVYSPGIGRAWNGAWIKE